MGMNQYRAVLEVLKWMHPSDILNGPYYVTKRWVEACNSSELWAEFLPTGTIIQDISPKLMYFQLFTNQLFVVLADRLLSFDVTTHIWSEKHLSRQLPVEIRAGITLAGLDYVLVLSLNSRTENNVRIRISTGEVESLPLMTPDRCAMGVISCYGRTYAFCGITSSPTQYCNMFTHKSLEWTKLQKAEQKRYHFNPCEHAKLIYLLGGNSEKVPAETYNTLIGTFTSLPYSLKIATCVSFICEGNGVVVTKSKLTERKLASGNISRTVKLFPSLVSDVYTGFSPIIHSGNAYFLQRTFARVVEVSLDTGKWQGHWYPGERTHYRSKK